jgi:regulator of protease activity HflC (stomatin/prohibitin superfamily)
MECRIGDPNKKDPQGNLVYPYDPEAVKKAVERYSLKWPKIEEEPVEFAWVDAAWGQVTGVIPRYIGSRMLDDIIIADRKSGQILSPQALEKLLANINEATNAFGVFVTNLQVTNVILPKEVQEQHKTFWEVERQSISTIIQGEAQAFSIRTREKARADAQRNLILAIAEGLEKNKASPFNEPLLLSLSRIVDDSLQDPLIRAQLANDTLDTLEKLHDLLDK